MFISEEGCLLRKTPSGETFTLMVFFLRHSGLLHVLARQSRSIRLPDLFASGRLLAERKKSSSPAFFSDFEPQRSFEDLGHSYDALRCASSLARFFELNLVHMEFFDEAWEILHQALEAMASKPLPQAALLKACYLLARTEGYPVHSQWLLKRPEEESSLLMEFLRQPAENIRAGGDELRPWIRDLAGYLEKDTDLVIPPGM